MNRLISVTDPLGGVTAFGYDPNGNLLSVTDARSSVTSYTYTSMDRLASRTDPLLKVESYQSPHEGVVFDGEGGELCSLHRRGTSGAREQGGGAAVEVIEAGEDRDRSCCPEERRKVRTPLLQRHGP